MARKKARRSRSKPEVILKQFVHYRGGIGGRSQSEPALLLLANREGYKWLSEYFGELANRTWHTSNDWGDPDDHQHLFVNQPPFNEKLSDSMEIRMGVLNAENRRTTLEQYNISKDTARRNSLIARYRMFIEWAKRHISFSTRF
jgi:hypothetical protein